MSTVKRWAKNWHIIAVDTFSAAGLLWLLTEVIDYFFPTLHQQLDIRYSFFVFVAVSLLYGLVKNYPKSSFSQKIRNRDSHIEIKIGDAFNNKGALIVPINDEFDVSLNGNVRKAKSIQNKLIKSFYASKEDHFKNDIQAKIDLGKAPFPMGTVVEVEQNDKRFYLLVNSKKNPNSRPSSTIDDFMTALNGVWDFLSSDAGKDEAVTIPLINTQYGRNPDLTRDSVIRQIIDTFINSSKYKDVCWNLIISIHPSDIQRGELDFESLSEYLKFQCLNYKDTKFNPKQEGKEIEVSSIAKLIHKTKK